MTKGGGGGAVPTSPIILCTYISVLEVVQVFMLIHTKGGPKLGNTLTRWWAA